MRRISTTARLELLLQLDKALYHKAKTRQHHALCEIILANSRLHRNGQPYFTFEGELYAMKAPKGTFPRLINLLHRDLRGRFKDWLKQRDTLEEERTLALGYVQRIMALTDCIEDYYRLLPRNLAPTLRKVDRFFIQGEGKLSETEAQAFLQDNHKYILAMKSRMTMNLLDVR